MSNTLMNINQAAAYLSLQPSTLRAWILHRKIGYVKLGKSVRIRLSDLDAIIQAGSVPARPDSR